MNYQEIMIIIGVFLLLGSLFYQKVVKGTRLEVLFKRIIRIKKKDKFKFDSEIVDILNAIGDKYVIINYTVNRKDGTIRLNIKRIKK